MEALKHPVNFVIPEKYLWPEMREGRVEDVTDAVLAQRCVGAINNWVVIPYIYFHRAGLAPRHSPKPAEGAINIASTHDLGIRERTFRAFIVCCRADAHAPELANFVFEQNRLREGAPAVAWTPHWPNPGLIPRDPARGDCFETLAYKGDIGNLWVSFRDESFRRALGDLGVELRLDLRTPANGAPLRMHDYRDVDAVIAVRNLTEGDVRVKPASKLVNAWSCGTPALLGAEPGFQELREDELDYIEIDSPRTALDAIRNLKCDPGLATRMRERGFARARGALCGVAQEIRRGDAVAMGLERHPRKALKGRDGAHPGHRAKAVRRTLTSGRAAGSRVRFRGGFRLETRAEEVVLEAVASSRGVLEPGLDEVAP